MATEEMREEYPEIPSHEAAIEFLSGLGIVKDVLPKIHEEYQLEYPLEAAHYKHLKSHYTMSLSLHLNEEMIDDPSKPDLGTIFEPEPRSLGPRPTPRRAFSCGVPRAFTLTDGQTCVAAQASDLSLLLQAQLQTGSNPISLTIVNKCPYALAKTRIIQTMFEMGHRPESIVEVWASTGWDAQAQEELKVALEHIASREGFDPRTSAVDWILDYWKKAPQITVDEARREWLARASHGFSSMIVFNLTSKEDRVAVSRYDVTGEFMGDNIPVAGNTTIFSAPVDAPPVVLGESIFEILPMSELLKNKDAGPFVQVGWEYMVNRVKQLGALMRKDQPGGRALTVNLLDDVIAPHNKAILDKVKALKPSLMLWEDVVDNFFPNEFHKMARYVSAKDTVHMGRSETWPHRVFGAGFADYPLDQRRELLTKAKESIEQTPATDPHGRLVKEPITTHYNFCDHYISSNWQHVWLEWFTKGQEAEGFQLLCAEMDQWTVLEGARSVLHLRWTHGG
ncbi:hypothetical protein HDV00_001895 [Rhizophlyctis rosea]|nr:hypothetical protein HDV00_001895 [Rhizophlyctis rosea]